MKSRNYILYTYNRNYIYIYGILLMYIYLCLAVSGSFYSFIIHSYIILFICIILYFII